MKLFSSASLRALNTMSLPATARYLAILNDEADAIHLFKSVLAKRFPLVILGGGSNVLLAPTLNAVVVSTQQLKGITCIQDTETFVIVEAMAGEEWHDFVQFTLSQGWYGLENLSLIPGTVGASPVQNVGAYGVEVADRIVQITAIEVATGRIQHFQHDDCLFAYRDSIFKQHAGRWLVTRVQFKLYKKANLVLGYGDVAQKAGIKPTPQSVSNAICTIRAEKLPNPKYIPNTGSFFKNPVVNQATFERLKQQYPTMPAFKVEDSIAHTLSYKLASGWLIDQAGFKGQLFGVSGSADGVVAMYEKQALVLVNIDRASLAGVLGLQKKIEETVFQQFGVQLEREPILISPMQEYLG